MPDNTDPGSAADDNPEPAAPPATERFTEELADLQTTISQIQAEQAALRARLDELTDLLTKQEAQHAATPSQPGPPPYEPAQPRSPAAIPLPSDDAAPDDHPSGQSESDTSADEDAGAPTFILLFDADSPEEHQELLALDNWVSQVLVPTYINQVSSRQPWCARWWDHPEARARLHALWLAWQEHTDETVGGHSGPSLWHRDHLHPAMIELRSHDGPFYTCMIDPGQAGHRPNRSTPVEPYPATPVPPAQ